MKNFLSKNRRSILLFLGLTLVMSASFANMTGTIDDSSPFSKGYKWLNDRVHGDLGLFLAVATFIISIILAVAKQSIMIFIGGFAMCIAIAFGADAAIGIVESSTINSTQHIQMILIQSIMMFGVGLLVRHYYSKQSQHDSMK